MTAATLLFEVYVRQWLCALADEAGHPIDLTTVPDAVLDAWASLGVTHVWLMGVWPTGPLSRAQARELPELRRAYDDALPGWTDADVCGSPYAVAAYEVDPSIGGDEGLAALRARLATRGIGVVLDFVPNHTGLDHRWARERPELYVGAAHPFDGSVEHSGRWLAHGKDPYFPGWTDTLQLDYRRNDTQAAMIDVLTSIAARCDGVRCDMAMLALRDVFARTWAHVPHDGVEAPRSREFWQEAVATIRADHPGFVFLAEAYWDLEDRLCALGFDYAYDKRLYDDLHRGEWTVTERLRSLGERNATRAHFLENHDEPRAAVTFDDARHVSVALLTLALPGVRFVHDGQLEGRRTFARIQLRRRRDEPANPAIAASYDTLFAALSRSLVGRGDARFVDARAAWGENPTYRAFTLIEWQAPGDTSAFDLIVVNHASTRAQCYASLAAAGLRGGVWTLDDALSRESYERDGDELATRGLYLDVGPHAAQLFQFRRCGGATGP